MISRLIDVLHVNANDSLLVLKDKINEIIDMINDMEKDWENKK